MLIVRVSSPGTPGTVGTAGFHGDILSWHIPNTKQNGCLLPNQVLCASDATVFEGFAMNILGVSALSLTSSKRTFQVPVAQNATETSVCNYNFTDDYTGTI